MALWKMNRIWKEYPIPVITLNWEDAADWIKALNKRVRFPLFICCKQEDLSRESVKEVGWIAVSKVSEGEATAEVIGYQGAREHPVKASDQKTVVHEMMHVLGFLHEQYHGGYPWYDNDPEVKKATSYEVDPSYDFNLSKTKFETKWNEALYKQLLEEYKAEHRPAMFVDFQLFKRAGAIKDSQIRCSLDCDFDSVMMYKASRKAVLNLANCPLTERWSRTAAADHGNAYLSGGDTQALRDLYFTKTKRPDKEKEHFKSKWPKGGSPEADASNVEHKHSY